MACQGSIHSQRYFSSSVHSNEELGLEPSQICKPVLQLYILMHLSKLFPLRLISLIFPACTCWSCQATLLSAQKRTRLFAPALPWLMFFRSPASFFIFPSMFLHMPSQPLCLYIHHFLEQKRSSCHPELLSSWNLSQVSLVAGSINSLNWYKNKGNFRGIIHGQEEHGPKIP